TQSFFDFQNQDIDPDWSLQTERQISDYLTAKPEITSKYGVPIVHCRTTSCQMLVTSYVSGEGTLGEELRRVLAEDWENQAWSAQFIGSVETHEQDGVETLVFYLARMRTRATP